jgi:hypothetical protein
MLAALEGVGEGVGDIISEERRAMKDSPQEVKVLRIERYRRQWKNRDRS